MPLEPRTRVGAYEIVGPIGAGGMGEVYRAKDTKLNREVAIKILPDVFAHDSERVARFTREAQTLASLNHPNIAQIFGVIEEDQPAHVHALVMELVEGEDLSVLIARHAGLDGGRGIPLADALPIAKQIAEALEAAHEQGIIHRDLKPANIKVRPDGTVKVLDFGLAKALDAGSKDPASISNAAHSPTLTAHATQMGMIIGTAAYMAPEQARGKAVDKRADIWAFGVVVYEMLTGRRLFPGDEVSDTLAAVLRQDVDWQALPSSTPPALAALLRRCLEREPKQRLRDIGEARLEISRIDLGASGAAASAPPFAVADPPAGPARPARPWVSPVMWVLIAALGAAAGAAGVGWYRASRVRPTPALRFNMDLGTDVSLRDSVGGPTPNAGPVVVLSPDGSRVAFTSEDAGGTARILSRRFDQPKALALDGTEGGVGPFFSPDGTWIGFFAGGKLKKIRVEGGPAITLCDAPDPLSAAWAEDGSIILSAGLASGLMRLPEAGGTPQPLTPIGDRTKEVSHRWPQALPHGKGVLFTAGIGGRFEESTIAVQTPEGVRKDIYRGGTFGRYLQSGHLTFVAKGVVFAAPFDLEKLELSGDPVPVLEGVRYAPDSGGAQFAAAANGMMVFREGSGAGGITVMLMDRGGKETALLATPGFYGGPVISPEGKRVAMLDSGQVAIYDPDRDAVARLTFAPTTHIKPYWSPDGRHVAYGTPDGLYWKRADGAGEPHRLVAEKATPSGFTPDGKRLVYLLGWGATRSCWWVELSGDPDRPQPGKPQACFGEVDPVNQADLSPDGRWLAYSSAESGSLQVYVRPFPDRGGKWQISAAGGSSPVWSPRGGELFFHLNDHRVMAVDVATQGDSLRLGRAAVWAQTPVDIPSQGANQSFSVTPDGKRLVFLRSSDGNEKARSQVVLVQNFFTEIERRFSSKRN